MKSFFPNCLTLFFLANWFCPQFISSSDKQALLRLKSSIDPSNVLHWRGVDFCKWEGIKSCLKNKVSKLVLENKNLTGTIDSKNGGIGILNQLDQIRVLSFKQNSISGRIPDLSGLTNLKSLYLSDNNFSGEFPASITTLHRLKTIVLSRNRLSSNVPDSLLDLHRLYVLYLDGNRFSGRIPPFNQTNLRYLNLSDNQFSGEIPATGTLLRFNSTSFSGNMDLCSDSFHLPCGFTFIFTPMSLSPPESTGKHYHRHRITRIVTIIAFIVGGLSLFCVVITLLMLILRKGKKRIVGSKGVEAVTTAAGGGGMNGNGESVWEGGDMRYPRGPSTKETITIHQDRFHKLSSTTSITAYSLSRTVWLVFG